MDEELGPVTKAVGERAPFGPMEKLEHEQLVEAQHARLAMRRRSYSLSARLLFAAMDLVYGKRRDLEKFRVLELVARVPYQAWESVAYVALTHTSRRPEFARRVYDRARAARLEQDNEQWHLLILEDLTAGTKRSWLKGTLIPQLLAVTYYQISWILYVVKPMWSYRLNADFEDHAAHEYALLVKDHPEWETASFESRFSDDYGDYDSLADLFRQISHDEALHQRESESMMGRPRFD